MVISLSIVESFIFVGMKFYDLC